MKRLTDVLQNQGENYILPFFWQHGETEAKLREYMNAIHDCGIGAVCCECRPHPDFCGPQWWHDMDVILDEAKKLDMKVWILDDAHFPTGQANGAMVEAPAELCKQFLHYHETEISGPTPGITLDVATMARYRKNPMSGGDRMSLFSAGAPAREFDDDELVAVVAADGLENGIDGRTLIDITDQVHDGVLTWDVPAGYWRVFVVYKTRNGGGNAHYINAVSFPSCRVQLDAVYEPHWAHYKDEFGKTIAGFFSDEPQLGNVSGFDPDNWIGKKMPLPWSDEVESELKTRLGDRYTALLATLWFPDKSGPDAAFARYHYMDVITRAVERDFSFQIGDWCAAHGVKYIGHTIEDNNEHARMGQSFAHQFRGLGGQHMGGIDDIGGQVLFGADHLMRSGGLMPTAGEPISDGEFFHYMLGKLGASHGHLDPRKRGDSMCEIFGAYGWSEGTRLMKYLADHFMVRGVNHFVPHAFSPREFPDYDCPPHFYAHGLNPLYKGFGQLMRYMNRVCHLISGGTAKPAVAVLYHAEGEWTSREEGYLLTQKPLRVLAQAQIDADILWTDVLVERERYQATLGRTLTVAGTSFRALVIPYSYYITSHLAAFLTEAQAAGFPVYFVGGRPQAIADVPEMPLPAAVADVPVLTLDALAAAMAPYADVRLDAPFPGLRYLRYGHESDLYFFTNESPDQIFSGRVCLTGEGTPVLYDPMANRLRPAAWDGAGVTLTLEPYQSVVVAFGHSGEAAAPALPEGSALTLTGPWQVSFKEALDQSAGYRNPITVDALTDMARYAPKFSGWVRYETRFTAPAAAQAVLRFANAFETVEVTVNGRSAGMAICPPYQFDLSGLLTEGENTLVVEVATTLERAVANLPVDPSNPRAALMSLMGGGGVGYPFGLLGEATLWLK